MDNSTMSMSGIKYKYKYIVYVTVPVLSGVYQEEGYQSEDISGTLDSLLLPLSYC